MVPFNRSGTKISTVTLTSPSGETGRTSASTTISVGTGLSVNNFILELVSLDNALIGGNATWPASHIHTTLSKSYSNGVLTIVANWVNDSGTAEGIWFRETQNVTINVYKI